jgi:hypothetical protein
VLALQEKPPMFVHPKVLNEVIPTDPVYELLLLVQLSQLPMLLLLPVASVPVQT